MAMAVWSTQVALEELLPADIMLDIISRLPAKSVIRCTCVCRSWCSLLHLNNHHFSRLHLHQQQKQIASLSNQVDVLTKYIPDKDGVSGQESFELLEYIDHDVDDNAVQVVDVLKEKQDDRAPVEVADVIKDDDEYSNVVGNYRVTKVDHQVMINYDYYHHKKNNHQCTKPLNRFVEVVGSCNGLVCLGCFGDPTYICNPVTREYVNLPNHNGLCPGFYSIASGFGCHLRNADEYKVVRIYYNGTSIRSMSCEGQVEVYTVGKDRGRWRNKGPIPYQLDPCQRGILLNGTLYWITTIYSMSGLRTVRIVAFDLAEEEFYAVAKLPEEWSHYERPSRIRTLGGCLCLINLATIAPKSTDIWVMKNCERNNESWVKEFSIPKNWSACDPFSLTKNGEILAWYNHEDNPQVFLVHYNPKTGNFKHYPKKRSSTISSVFIEGAVPHVKSFISLKDLGEEDARQVNRHERVLKVSRKRKASSCLKSNLFSEESD